MSTIEQDVAAVLDTLRSGWLTMGPQTQAFEAAFAERLGAPHAVAVSSGTAALQLAVLGAGAGPGDEVLIAGLAAADTVAAVGRSGAAAVACELEPDAPWGPDLADVARRISGPVRAIVVAHPYGAPVALGELRSLCDAHAIPLIEDCTEALGAEGVGRTGDLACFSLADDRQLSVGEGGVVTARGEQPASTVRALRSHAMTSVTWDRHRGHAESYDVLGIGFNFRLDEPRAALARSRLARLDDVVAVRRRAARDYAERLRAAGVLAPWPQALIDRASPLAFPVLLADAGARAAAETRLEAAARPTTRPRAALAGGQLTSASELAARLVSLPIPADEESAERIGAAVEALVGPSAA